MNEIGRILTETFNNPEVIKLLAAVALGGAIGLEREVSNKVAGLRTNMLICLGSALYTIVSVKVFDVRDAHIAAQILTGIGFIGAGSILRDGDRITGLTTAATVWTVAAIGMAVGFGFFTLGAVVAILVLSVQLAFTKFDILIDDWRMRHTFRITSKLEEKGILEIEKIFRDCRIKIITRKLMKKNQLYYSEWFTTGARHGQEAAMKKLLHSQDVIEVVY